MNSIIKIIIIIILCVAILGIVSLLQKNIYKEGSIINNHFFVVKEINVYLRIVYDIDTNVMYYMCGFSGGNNFAICPYYITEDKVGVYNE